MPPSKTRSSQHKESTGAATITLENRIPVSTQTTPPTSLHPQPEIGECDSSRPGMLGDGVKQGEYTVQEAPDAEDTEQDVAPDALRKNGPAEFIDVEVAAGGVAVS